MVRYIIKGGTPLRGEVSVSGAKNAAVAIIPASLMVDGVCRIENLPQISDVSLLLNIQRGMGAKISTVNSHTVDIDSTRVNSVASPTGRSIRATYYFVGALLGRFHRAQVPMPGGCDFGVRPIDQHIKGFEAMGAEIEIRNGIIYASAPNGLKGTNIYLDIVSVGATINIMLAASMAEGMTVIENAAKEPHIVDVANFLNSMGANIMGAGTDVIKIRGVRRLRGGFYSIIPDQIEAGTYLTAVAATGGKALIKNVIPKHLDSITAKLEETGVSITEFDDSILIERSGPLNRINIKTMPYPGFPTDMQPQIATLLSIAEGTSVITEGVWDNRFRYVNELKRMGAKIQVDGKVAVIEGVSVLTAAQVKACDLRAGAALIIAALSASGTSEIDGVYHIERGYEDIVEKFKALGADIKRIVTPDSDDEDVRNAV